MRMGMSPIFRAVPAACLAAVLLFGLFLPAAAQAPTEVWVCPSGDCGHPGTGFNTIAAALTAVAEGGVIHVAAGTYVGATLNKPVSVDLANGAAVQGGSAACFTVAANDISILSTANPGATCTPPAGRSGIVVSTPVERLMLQGLQIIGTSSAANNGIYINSTVVDLKILENNIRSFATGAGLRYSAAGVVSGVHEVLGNLFTGNAAGIANASGTLLLAEYNAWGSTTCPTLTNVDAAPCTHTALSMITSGSLKPGKVLVDQEITYSIRLTAAELYGADFKISFAAVLPYADIVAVNDGLLFGAADLCRLSTAAEAIAAGGVVSFCGYRTTPLNGVDQVVFSVVLRGKAISPPALSIAPAAGSAFAMVAPGGSTRILPAALGTSTAQVMSNRTVTGTIDLQGRPLSSGAQPGLAVGAAQAYGPFSAVTLDAGTFSMVNVVDDSYAVTVEMPRYLDLLPRNVTISASKTSLQLLRLIAGDANDDGSITISDVSIVGAMYGKTGASLTDARGDIDANNIVNIYDLVLVGGGFGKTESTAYSSWVP